MLLEQIAVLRAVYARLRTRLREWLTGKSSAKNVVRRNIGGSQLPNVEFRANAKILLIQLTQPIVDLTCKNATVPKIGQSKMESAEPRE
jgi:hypothetical protein